MPLGRLGAAGAVGPGPVPALPCPALGRRGDHQPALEQARAIASRLSEARGWNPRIQAETNRALAVMLASHVPGEKIPWSALEPALRPRDLSVSRTAEILSLAGLLDDDRVLPLAWTEAKLATLAPGIAACARSWLHALQHGTPRSRPRNPDTIRIYLRSVHPLLEGWSAATVTCARSPPATSPRRSPHCAATSDARPSSRCGP